MHRGQSSRFHAVIAPASIALVVSQSALAIRRDSGVDWLLAAAGAVLAAASVALSSKRGDARIPRHEGRRGGTLTRIRRFRAGSQRSGN